MLNQKKFQKKVLLVDVDGPLYDLAGKVYYHLTSQHSDLFSKSDIDAMYQKAKDNPDLYHFDKCTDNVELALAVFSAFGDPNIYKSDEHVVWEGFRTLAQHSNEFYFVFISNCTPTSYEHKLGFVKRAIDKTCEDLGLEQLKLDEDYSFIATKEKWLVKGHAFIDDQPNNVNEWAMSNPGRTTLLFDTEFNQNIETSGTRLMGWAHFPDAIKCKY